MNGHVLGPWEATGEKKNLQKIYTRWWKRARNIPLHTLFNHTQKSVCMDMQEKTAREYHTENPPQLWTEGV